MPATPALNARVTITCKDINNNSVAKTFNYVTDLKFDYFKGTTRIVDSVQGEFYFPLIPSTSIAFTITGGIGGSTVVVIS